MAVGDCPYSLAVPLTKQVAVAKLLGAAQEFNGDPLMPYLNVDVNGDRVSAQYAVGTTTRRDQPWIMIIRPVFRGQMVDCGDSLRLVGRFGVNFVARAIALAALVLLISSICLAAIHSPTDLWPETAASLLLFIGLSVVTRGNSDDIRLIASNLDYALTGED